MDAKLISTLRESGNSRLIVRKNDNDVVDSSVIQVNEHYPGGVAAYLANARRLLRPLSNSAAETAPTYSPPLAICELDPEKDLPMFLSFEKAGIAASATSLGVVLVAGGMGERLGYSGIKLELPLTGFTSESYLAFYVAWCRRVGARLAIMTSAATHDATMLLLRELGVAAVATSPRELNPPLPGLADCVAVMRQQDVLALVDRSATIAVSSSGEAITKPHGHGDVHSLLLHHGVLAAWAAAGIRWLSFLQDTNALAVRAVLPAIGVLSSRPTSTMAFLCVNRHPGEAIGVVATVTSIGAASKKSPVTANVEYHIVDKVLGGAGVEGFAAGNCNTLVLRMEPYFRVVTDTGGLVEEFVNPKLTPSGEFKSPTRLECLMQDISIPLSRTYGADSVIAVSMPRWMHFSPTKNPVLEGAKSAEMTPITAEHDYFEQSARILRLLKLPVDLPAGRRIVPGKPTVGGVVVISPAVCPTVLSFKSLFGKNGSLVLRPKGALILSASAPPCGSRNPIAVSPAVQLDKPLVLFCGPCDITGVVIVLTDHVSSVVIEHLHCSGRPAHARLFDESAAVAARKGGPLASRDVVIRHDRAEIIRRHRVDTAGSRVIEASGGGQIYVKDPRPARL